MLAQTSVGKFSHENEETIYVKICPEIRDFLVLLEDCLQQ
jgi:hypothetical protein